MSADTAFGLPYDTAISRTTGDAPNDQPTHQPTHQPYKCNKVASVAVKNHLYAPDVQLLERNPLNKDTRLEQHEEYGTRESDVQAGCAAHCLCSRSRAIIRGDPPA